MSDTCDAAFATAFADADAGRLVEAAAGLENALRAAPDNHAARTRLGMIQRTLGDIDAALASFELVHAAMPTLDSARLNLAAVLDETGDQARALRLIADARGLLTASPQARWMAAHVLLRAGDYRQGFGFYEARWEQGDPNLPDAQLRQAALAR